MSPNRDRDSDAAGTDTAGAAADANPGSERDDGQNGDADGDVITGRDVVVPMRLYKTVTVFSTLIAVLLIVFGFTLIDAATQGGGAVRALVGVVLRTLGASVTSGELAAVFRTLSPVVAALGLLCIAGGAGVYVLGTRFRTREMGKSQGDSGEDSDNG